MRLAVDERGHIIRVLGAQATRLFGRHVVLDECRHFGHAVHSGPIVIGPGPPHRRHYRRYAGAFRAMAPAALLQVDLLTAAVVWSQFWQMDQAAPLEGLPDRQPLR